MNGSANLDQILSECPPDLSVASLARCLYQLHERGILVDGTAGTSTPPHLGNQAAGSRRLYWERHLNVTGYNTSAEEVESRIANSHVLVVGGGAFGESTSELLRAAGVCVIHVSGMRPGDNPSILKIEQELNGSSSLLDITILATRHSSSAYLSGVNLILMRFGMPFMFGNEFADGYDIGPLVLPYSSGCYECMRLRGISMNQAAIEEELFQKHLDAHAHRDYLLGEFATAASLAAAVMVNDAIRVLSKIGTSGFLESALRFNPVVGVPVLNRFQRVPNCPSCTKPNVLQQLATK